MVGQLLMSTKTVHSWMDGINSCRLARLQILDFLTVSRSFLRSGLGRKAKQRDLWPISVYLAASNTSFDIVIAEKLRFTFRLSVSVDHKRAVLKKIQKIFNPLFIHHMSREWGWLPSWWVFGLTSGLLCGGVWFRLRIFRGALWLGVGDSWMGWGWWCFINVWVWNAIRLQNEFLTKYEMDDGCGKFTKNAAFKISCLSAIEV